MTAQLSLPIDADPGPLRMPPEPIVRQAVVVADYRLTMVRAWGAGPRLAIAGKNPSTADGKRDDPATIRNMGFAYRWGFGSLVQVNVYPLITPSPAELGRWLATRPSDFAGRQIDNLHAAGAAVKSATMRLAIWGAGVARADLDLFLSEIDRMAGKAPWMCLDVNDDGSPLHTLARGRRRIPDDARPRPWVLPS
jgi:hypothetical protein